MGQTGSLKPLTCRAEVAARRPVWIRWSVFVVVALLGLAVRLPQLGARPMHTDEAINAYIVGQLLAGQSFHYDATDRHGPALSVLALPLARLQGAKAFSDLTESELRLTAVVAGTVTILLFGAAVDMFGFAPCVIAALLFACAPLPVYYDRYFIHESLFAAATFGLILAGWRSCRDRSIVHAALAGASAALMLACKETAVLHFFALAAAALVYWLWNLRGERCGSVLRLGAVLTATAVFLLLNLVLFTWFGSNWKAIAELMHAGPSMLARAGGEGHEKPFWYFGKLLIGGWSGGLISALACVGFLLTVRKRDGSPYGFLGWYAMCVAIMYSLIPYKTPWLALNFWLPMALFAGMTMKWLWSIPARYPAVRIPMRAFCFVLGAMIAILIEHDTRIRVFAHPTDEGNPYAYAHTSEDLLGLAPEMAEVARQDALASPRIAVIASDPWPLPWYLRHYSQVGFWQPGQKVGLADFYITSTEASEQYKDQLKDLRPEFFGARPGVLILLWEPAPK
ncbi:MAG: flippase activity-associated protein Agl23 [Terracidiphilus sp.]